MFQDFDNKEFTNRNVRVRPVSGPGIDDTKDRQSNVSRGQGEEKEDVDERFNQEAQLEIDNDRKNIKAILRRKLEEAERKAAAEALKKKRNE